MSPPVKLSELSPAQQTLIRALIAAAAAAETKRTATPPKVAVQEVRDADARPPQAA